MLKDKVILVTGGASGIGRACVEICASRGAKMVITDINGEAAEAVAKDLVDKGAEAVAMRADIASEEDAKAQVAFALQRFGRLDGAYNNAGTNRAEVLTHEEETATFRRVIETNLIGNWFCMKHQIPAMLERGGSIVFNASDAGKAGTPRFSSYGASKAGIINMMQTAAVEYARENIRFNAVCPGPIASPPMRALLAQSAPGRYLDGLPMKRYGEPHEVSELVAFLLSDRASYITGQAISVDGGFAASFS